MRHLLHAVALLGSLSFTLMAEDMAPPAPGPAPAPAAGAPSGLGGPGGPEAANDRRALMKEMMELDGQLRPMREKIAQDPELIKLKTAADDARKAVRTKEDELLAADPAFAELKVKRDKLIEKMSAAGVDPNRPLRKEPKEGKPGKGPAPAPGADVAPVPAPKL